MHLIPVRRSLTALVLLLPVAAGPGCESGQPGPELPTESSIQGDPDTNRAIQEELTGIVNDAVGRFKPLKYEYDEGLLKTLDQVEAHLSGKATGPAPRFMPKLDEAEEQDHFRETIRRWEKKTGQSLRAGMDPLIAEVAARKPGESFHADFHKRFGLVFDSFIPIEVGEARERQNRAIHDRVDKLLAGYQEAHPEEVKQFRAKVDKQFPLTPPTAEAPPK